MGYKGHFQENYPGSPAQRLHRKVGRIAMIYTLVVGGLCYMYVPFVQRYKKELAENKHRWEDTTDWWVKNREGLRNSTWTQSSSKEYIDSHKELDKLQRGDFAGPEVDDEVIRSMKFRRS